MGTTTFLKSPEQLSLSGNLDFICLGLIVNFSILCF